MSTITSNYQPSPLYISILKDAIAAGYRPSKIEQDILRSFKKRKQEKRIIDSPQTIAVEAE